MSERKGYDRREMERKEEGGRRRKEKGDKKRETFFDITLHSSMYFRA